jgi:hypothetical protein
VRSLLIYSEGERLVYSFLICVMILNVNNGKGRYWLLVLFIVALCAGYYTLLYLFR